MFIVKICVILLLVALANGQRKSGECPDTINADICFMSCNSDRNCRGIKKCCRTACGGTVCSAPVRRLEKDGRCPSSRSGPWVCTSRCSRDFDCQGEKKCCPNRCGAMDCTKAEPLYD